jgi:hypothetical protein
MQKSVAASTQCEEVGDLVMTEFAPRPQMMDLQVDGRTAVLTPPTVPFQHLESKSVIFLWIELQARFLLA